MPHVAGKDGEYLLGHSAVEQERLCRQTQELAADSIWLLNQLNLKAGNRAVDIGCGPQGILDLLSERVGSKGKVTGVEASERTAQLARRFVNDRKLTNVEILQADAKATDLPRASFDLAHARLVLVNVPAPQRVLEEMVALVRPGGLVASHEADWRAFACDPPSPAHDRLFEVLERYSRISGIDLFVGRKVPRMMRAAGLIDIKVNPIVHSYPPGNPRRRLLCDFLGNLRDRILEQGLIAENEFRERMSELERHLLARNSRGGCAYQSLGFISVFAGRN